MRDNVLGLPSVERRLPPIPGDTTQQAHPKWIVCQLGAREHYTLPLALHRAGRLAALYTDIWTAPGWAPLVLPGGLGRRLRARYTRGLEGVQICSFTKSALISEFVNRSVGRTTDSWSCVLARNDWFQRRVVRSLTNETLDIAGIPPIVFSYSYTAREIFRYAKAHGCMAVLGQIDPGPIEEEIVAEAVARNAALAPNWSHAPRVYWDRWHEECELADRIVVNSEWSKQALIKAGIDRDKIRIVPLSYDGPVDQKPRTYPCQFSERRPLRVLFLGSLIIRKGLAELLDAIHILRNEPIEFLLIGPMGIDVPPEIRKSPKLQIRSPVSRGEVGRYYREADLFILPTLSDGFGLTQIEALAHGLPTIASRFCGHVVVNNVNGLVLDSVTAQEIATALSLCVGEPDRLSMWSAAAVKTAKDFTTEVVAKNLIDVI